LKPQGRRTAPLTRRVGGSSGPAPGKLASRCSTGQPLIYNVAGPGKKLFKSAFGQTHKKEPGPKAGKRTGFESWKKNWGPLDFWLGGQLCQNQSPNVKGNPPWSAGALGRRTFWLAYLNAAFGRVTTMQREPSKNNINNNKKRCLKLKLILL